MYFLVDYIFVEENLKSVCIRAIDAGGCFLNKYKF